MVAVTGGSGRAGAYIIRELAEHRRQVRNVDQRGPAAGRGWPGMCV